MTTVRVRRPPARYRIRVRLGLLSDAGPLLRRHRRGGLLLLVTDRTVSRLYGRRVRASLRRAGFDVHTTVLPPGERSKSLESVRRLYREWARLGAGRGALVVALGGGVVSDVAGYAAATFVRGLDWVVFPTTLLSQADASIGGKTGVNLTEGKNMVGAYHHPLAVYSDPEALRTLRARAFRSGLAEVVKMGVIRRPELLVRIELLLRRGALREPARLAPIIRLTAAEKARYVSRDERDRGPRRELNFGHTVGHALEAAYGYGRYLHGEAVAVGMAAALRLSVLAAGLRPRDAARVHGILKAAGLPTRLPDSPGPAFWGALLRDKKRGRRGLRVVLSPAIGRAKVFDLPSLTP
ncbi:MAG TPA: 3-dehydroquinate synthase, partial [Candidatus Eisenbacteria bacterium]